jgi:hypothetical protein
VFAVSKEGEAIVLAVADPTDVQAVERLRREVRSPLSVRLATLTQIREQVDRHYGPKLIGVLPSGEKLEYLIDKHEVEIGKAAHNHITLVDPTVANPSIVSLRSRLHNRRFGEPQRNVRKRERLGSQAHTLRHGDKIQLGQTVLTGIQPRRANITAVLSGETLEEVRRRAGVPPSVASKRDTGDSEKPLLDAQRPIDEAGADALEDEKGKKKKKKKKKGGENERMKAAYIGATSRIVAQVLSVILAVLLALYVNSSMKSGPSTPPPVDPGSKGKVKFSNLGSGIPFQGGTFEASGAAFVRGANGVLMVDDGRSDEILWMQLDEAGRQVGPVKPIPLGVTVEDPEAITSDGSYFYIIGSQSQPNGGDRNALVRFTFDAASQSVPKAEALTNLRDFLLSNVPELNTGQKASEGGLNIEGIAWDFERGRWLLGLRSPQGKDGSALLVAVKLRNPAGAFSVDNLQLAEPSVIPLKLAGLGVRDIR